MILYSITINIDKEVHDEWIEWMQKSFLPSIMLTGYFTEKRVLKLMKEEENDDVTYSFQLYSPNMELLQEYISEKEGLLEKELYARYKNRFVEFRTFLELIDPAN